MFSLLWFSFARAMHKIAASGGFYSRTAFVYARLPPLVVYKRTEQGREICLFGCNIQINPHSLVQFV